MNISRINVKSSQVTSEFKEFQKNTSISTKDWDTIDWRKHNTSVTFLRRKIYAESKRLKSDSSLSRDKLVSLQKSMLFSYDNLVTSVRRVVVVNKGRNTPGLDDFIVKGKDTRAQYVRFIRDRVNIVNWEPSPVKRVYILKPNGKLRPLGIPTIIDRVIQSLLKNALEPYIEANTDIGSYGFRPGYGCHDAIEKLFRTFSGKNTPKKQWIVDADIKGCFDNIDHGYLMKKLEGFPCVYLLERYLKAGYVEHSTFHQSTGTPQGGIISPLLANVALNGMEEELGVKYRKRSSSNKGGSRIVLDDYSPVGTKHPPRGFVRYADDFVVLCETKEDANTALTSLEAILARRGLSVSQEKTSVVHINEGFNFLGFTIRRLECLRSVKGDRDTKVAGSKLLIIPSKKSVAKYKDRLKDAFTSSRALTASRLIAKTAPLIRGWCNYYSHCSASSTFQALDSYLYELQLRYAKRKHPNKGKKWITSKYFGAKDLSYPKDNWVFYDDTAASTKMKKVNQSKVVTMLKHRRFSIQRHKMVPNGASKDDPKLVDFWLKRQTMGTNTDAAPMYSKLDTIQRYTCPWCFDAISNQEPVEIHHIIPTSLGGNDTLRNKVILHKICHQALGVIPSPSVTGKLLNNLAEIKRGSSYPPKLKAFKPANKETNLAVDGVNHLSAKA